MNTNDSQASAGQTHAASCCGPTAEARTSPVPTTLAGSSRAAAHRIPKRLVQLHGGRSLVGTRQPVVELDGEGPLREVRVKPFAIDPYAVTNSWFSGFVAETGYVTEAERFGWSFVFHLLVAAEAAPSGSAGGAPWWLGVPGADWRHPEGPGSNISTRADHPVVHVSLNDARAFARWAGARLPTEAEWEYAARGGLGDVRYPWGDRGPDDQDFLPCNIWQGTFPKRNTAADGWLSTCPVNAFEPNGFGLYNMCGNTWEWCDQALRIRSTRKQLRVADENATRQGLMLTKGGSYLCHRSYCHRYRIAARTGNTPDSTTGHIGFRVIFDVAHEVASPAEWPPWSNGG